MIDDAICRVVIRLLAICAAGQLVQRRIGQVECLARLALRIQRRVALRRGLGDLVFNREQVHVILAGRHVGIDDDTFLIVFGSRHSHRVRS